MQALGMGFDVGWGDFALSLHRTERVRGGDGGGHNMQKTHI